MDIVGVVGVRSRWVGAGDPPRKFKFVECWMVFGMGGRSNGAESFVRVDL